MNALARPAELMPLDRLQRPLRDLRLSVIDACNFRCPYCMPADATVSASSDRLSFDEIETLVRGFVRLGVEKLRLTGGEPLLRRNLPQLLARLAVIHGLQDIALTTNGSLLSGQAAALRAAGLKRVTVSLDAVSPGLFHRMSGGRGDVVQTLDGIEAAARAGLPVKINCVVQRGVNEEEVLPLAAHFRGTGHVLRFIEYMDVGSSNGWRRSAVVPSAELHERLNAQWPLRPLDPTYRGEVATRHAYVDGGGEIGFVSSVTQPFCGDCSRARVSADGRLFTCLFASEGADLRQALAHGEQHLAEHLTRLWQSRGDRYSEVRMAPKALSNSRRVEMYLLGG